MGSIYDIREYSVQKRFYTIPGTPWMYNPYFNMITDSTGNVLRTLNDVETPDREVCATFHDDGVVCIQVAEPDGNGGMCECEFVHLRDYEIAALARAAGLVVLTPEEVRAVETDLEQLDDALNRGYYTEAGQRIGRILRITKEPTK